MNIPNNKKRKDSQEKIEKIFLEMIQHNDIDDISVTDICTQAGLNRTTFYSNYIDIYDLADKIRQKLENEVLNLYREETEQLYNNDDFLNLFNHIKDNQIFYKTYFKLGFDKTSLIKQYNNKISNQYYNNHVDYHITFFKAGLNAIIQKWLNNNCLESPEEMAEILKSEYSK